MDGEGKVSLRGQMILEDSCMNAVGLPIDNEYYWVAKLILYQNDHICYW
jgi:hypothetical protein